MNENKTSYLVIGILFSTSATGSVEHLSVYIILFHNPTGFVCHIETRACQEFWAEVIILLTADIKSKTLKEYFSSRFIPRIQFYSIFDGL